MLYIVTEFAKNGEMFGELHSFLALGEGSLPSYACISAASQCCSVLPCLAPGRDRLGILGCNLVLLFLRLSDFEWAPERERG